MSKLTPYQYNALLVFSGASKLRMRPQYANPGDQKAYDKWLETVRYLREYGYIKRLSVMDPYRATEKGKAYIASEQA